MTLALIRLLISNLSDSLNGLLGVVITCSYRSFVANLRLAYSFVVNRDSGSNNINNDLGSTSAVGLKLYKSN